MATMTKYPRTVSQTTGGKYVSWSNLNNIKNNAAGSYAVSSVLIKSKSDSPNRPSTITCTNFGFNLPVGAEPTKVVITYRHEKVAGSDYSSKYPKRICNIPSPTVSLVGISGFSSKAVAPTTDMESHTKTFKANLKDNKNLDHTVTANHIITRDVVNSSSFGVKINYPTNTNTYNGYMRVSFVRIQVEYTLSKYGVSVKKVAGGYNKEDYTVHLSISNKNMTNYKPSLTLTTPAGFSYKDDSASGTGTITQVNARTFTWDPKLSKKIGTSNIDLTFSVDVTYPVGTSSYSGTFTLVESLNGKTSNHTAVITERPVTSEETEEETVLPNGGTATVDEQTVINVICGNDFILDLDDILGTNYTDIIFMTLSFYGVTGDIIDYDGRNAENYFDDDDGCYVYVFHYNHLPVNGNWHLTAPQKYLVECGLIKTDYSNKLVKFYINVLPSEEDLSTPYLSILELTDEELDRLGDGYTYICQSDIKHITNDTDIRDWYKNNRIGVFNNPIIDNIGVIEIEDPVTGEISDIIIDLTDYDNLTIDEIFENADYWAESTAGLNEYSNVECEFTYNENYPLYIILAGDYEEAASFGYDIGEVNFTDLCIVEKTNYTNRLPKGNYPLPITYLIDDSSTSECTIASMNHSDPIVLYDFPLDEGYGTNDVMSIRGIELTGNIEQADEMIIDAKLVSDTGKVGERSVVLDTQDTTLDSELSFKLGGLGDLWGFNTQEILNLEDWELELSINNLILDDVGNINFGNLQLTIYIETLLEQEINIKVNGEDLSYFGAFIEEVVIPEGLKTDTSLLTIDGTDTNDAYRQNIREKTIEISFSIGECDILTSTDMLRQVTKRLVNEKDSINRPIPNTIEFSHYPNIVYEYIMTDPLDITPKQSFYEVKAKLMIPAGTAYSKQPTTTNIAGFVNGLAAVNPVITFKPQGSAIEIKELNSGQIFNMGYGGDWQSKIVELDCANRIAALKTNEDDSDPIDISGYVDFNSDWFSLFGEYSFSASNCIIRTVEYTERW